MFDGPQHRHHNWDFSTKGAVMKTLALLGFVVGAACIGGCGTPGLSPAERNQMIVRNFNYDGGQVVDDIDRDVLMIRPASHLTVWNVQDDY